MNWTDSYIIIIVAILSEMANAIYTFETPIIIELPSNVCYNAAIFILAVVWAPKIA